jgi:hypothetical protein
MTGKKEIVRITPIKYPKIKMSGRVVLMQSLSPEKSSNVPVISAEVVSRLPLLYQAVLKVAADRHDVVIIQEGPG